MRKCKDITGQIFGSLVAVSFTGKSNNLGYSLWLFKCSCGNIEERSTQRLKQMVKAGKCKVCILKQKTTHGVTKSKVYKTWQSIKDRCLNPNCRAYPDYGGSGITIQEDWINDFVKFRDYIGNPPDDGQRWSIDRIDNSLGYQEGNIRWATYSEQNRNRSKMKTNSSGLGGVVICKNDDGSCAKYMAHWYDLGGKYRTKSFSINKYGEELAFFMACEYREQMINLLNLQGAGYTERHGK